MAFNTLKKLIGDEVDEPTETTKEEGYSINQGKKEKETSKGTNQMILVEPRAYSESSTIADHLKSKNTVVVNLKRVTANQAKRIIDFLTGTLYAIGGEMQKIGPGIYLCTPKDVEVQGSITDDEKAKDKNDEEIDW